MMNNIQLIFFLVFIIFYKCNSTNKHLIDSVKIRAISVTGKIPTLTNDTSFVIEGAYEVFYYDDLIMYKFEYRYDSIVNGKLILQQWRPNFFVFHKDSVIGYAFYPPPNTTATEGRVSVDTMLKRNTYEPFRFDSIMHSSPDSTYLDADKNLVKVYSRPTTTEYPEAFTLYLYYSKKLNGIAETFSKNMDNVNGMKLFKIKILAHGYYYEQFKMMQPKREYLWEMKEIPVENPSRVMSYFERYKMKIITPSSMMSLPHYLKGLFRSRSNS